MLKRPNFILFITDQHRADFLGCYGHPVLKTPNIDRLADTGIRFDKFYVTSPVCMPNRASLMTCRMPSSHGVRANGIPLERRNVTFVEVLKAAGYETVLIGKSHLQNFSGRPSMIEPPVTRPDHFRADRPLDQSVRTEYQDPFFRVEEPDFWDGPQPKVPTPFYGFDHVELVTGHGDAAGGDYVQWLAERDADAASKIGVKNQLPHDYSCPQAVRTAVAPEHYSTTYIAERAAKWIEDRKDSDKPFFLMVSWPDPHHPFNPPGKYWDMYKPEEMALPAAFAANDWTPPFHVAAAIREREEGRANLAGMSTVACSAREALEARALTCGLIAMIDDALGTVVSSLDRTGRADDTVKIFTSDHGDHLGDHRLLFKGAEQYEQITRVPFIWSDPEGKAGEQTGAIGQTLDIGTTILERAMVEAPVGMQGIKLPVAGGEGRRAALIQYDHQKTDPAFGPQPRVHTLHDGRWRLSLYHGSDFGELYDLEADPEELSNLFDNPAATCEKVRLMEMLARAEIAVVDRAPGPTGQA
ncbi:sulfatase family protein [Chelativorans alearense]|uniref:sulfatase family protein n=1 Tax=Chelativorans alearense TaxID=2681495 RepID=UPI0013D43FC1|nr:sulfatase-like hydrolase/transferase [Chelativorans alearense]